MTVPSVPSFLGSFYCDHCSGEYRIPVWLLDGTRLCATHFRHVTGHEPPPALAHADLPEPPQAEPAWTKLLPGLRMRPATVGPGVELQGVRQVQLDGCLRTVGDAPAWTLNDAAMVELVLMASAHREDSEPNKALVRMVLLRILHGTTPP
jgi:hypothetical protein